MTSVPPIKVQTIKHLIEKVPADAELSFEFILATLFPTCWKNIQNDLKDKYTQGYIAGQRACAEMFSSEDDECYCD